MASNSTNNGRRYPGDRNRRSHKKSWAVAEGRKLRRKEKRGIARPSGTTGKLSLSEMIELTHQEPDDLAKIMYRDLKRFQQSLDTKILKESDKVIYIEAVIQIMSKVSLTHEDYKDCSYTVMAEFLSTRCSTFHLQLNEYVQTMNVKRSLAIIKKLCDLCNVAIESFRDQSHVLPISGLAELSLPQDLAEQVKSMVELQREIFQLQKQKQSRDKAKFDPTFFDTWDNSQYREMSVLPTVQEVVGKPPPLRSNIIKGSYTDWEHYYDIQFRLLREDFVAPLRKGISEFCSPNRTHQRPTDVYIYNNVKILEPVCTQEGLCYDIRIDLRGLNLRRSLEHTKRLMFGSLLCFSPDNFEKVVHFCIVTNRVPKDIRKGIIQVKFEESLEMLAHVNKTIFVVAESRAFFEASRHVLRSLQNAEVETMPFTRYLVLNQPLPLNRPKYLDPTNASYNMGAIYKTNLFYRNNVGILEQSNWPTSNDPHVELDQSQLDAIKMALTQEIAIIQGPPGTGKTYIGYKIVQALLENRHVWDPHKTSPILVMCFTNHALDQFLEGIIHHKIQGSDPFQTERAPKIVRVGGRSKSEEIQEFSLRNVRRNLVPRYQYREVQQLKKECTDIGSHITWKSTELKKIIQDPISLLVDTNTLFKLKQYIHPSHFYQITQLPDKDNEMQYYNNSLEMWLGLFEKKYMFQMQHAANPVVSKNHDHLSTAMEEEDESEEDETEEEERITVRGEAELEEETRKLETDDYSPLKATGTVSKVKDDTLTKFIKSKSKQKQGQKQGQNQEANQKYHSRCWVRKGQNEINKIVDMIRKAEPLEDYNNEMIPDVTDSSFKVEQRCELFRFWIKEYEEQMKADVQRDIRKYDRDCQRCKEADQRLDQVALERAEVIGMTTTGAAKYQHIIHLVKPKIVIVEEAAELIESHIVSALNAGTQHLILIGDHKQLRPKPNEFDLAMKHNLHISLFERLLLNGLPHATLMIQHRMRPQIASLVCPHIYDELLNHESVTKYEKVKGFRKNMYFFHHEVKEEFNQGSLSHSNEYEANFIVALCSHLLKLGYQHSQITILTAYSGQLLKVMNKMPKSQFEGVKITNVDNFQGEENDIIILSLVRNNDNGSVGFLKEENRVCVALSRARKGLYCFGNFNKLLRIKVQIWDNILTQVEADGCLGSAFPLQCPNHDDVKFEVSEPKDFHKYAPEGGCGRPCQQRLDCGHACRRSCHGNDLDHKDYRCQESCTKTCERGHSCSSYCYAPCPPCKFDMVRINPDCGHEQISKCFCTYEDNFDPCTFPMSKEIPKCGHTQTMMCSDEPEYFQCLKKCKKVLCDSIEHKCQKKCWEDCGECKYTVLKKLPNCNHSIELPCYYDPSNYTCQQPCSKTYQCGHLCPKKCGETCDNDCMKLIQKVVPKCDHVDTIPCSQKPENWSCQNKCKKVLNCGHFCKGRCGKECFLYECKAPQNLPLPCNHTITVECREMKVMQRKIKNGEQILCHEQCKKYLNCGHMCGNKCYESCTDKCKTIVLKKCRKGVHTIDAMCGESSPICKRKCRSKLSCGHSCTNKCWEECSTCNEEQDFECPCGHPHQIECGDEKTCDCRRKCRVVLECGHECSGKCGNCFSSRIHAPCPFEVHAKRYCGHYATVPCFGLEDKCTKVCQVASCLHTSNPCDHKCYESCDTECTEQCQYECTHNKCTRLCSEKCDVQPCNKPCNKMLDCGHQCLGLCGEKCLSICLHCKEKDFRACVRGIDKKSSLGSLLRKKYIQLSCDHIFTVDYLDKYYHPVQGKDRLVSPLICPTCQKIISACSRYIKIMKEKQQEINSVKSQVSQRTSDFQTSLDSEKNQQVQIIMSKLGIQANYNHLEIIIDESDESDEGDQSIEASLLFKNHIQLEILIEIGKLCETLIDTNLKKMAIQLFEQVIKKNTGKLSLQLINDIKRELYRISLLYMIGKVKEVLQPRHQDANNAKAFNSVQDLISHTKSSNSCLTREVYVACVDILRRIFKQNSSSGELMEPVNIEHISCPVITKGQWYCCAEGHYYFVPAKYCSKGKVETSCELCKQPKI